jgi:hypothetical protein
MLFAKSSLKSRKRGTAPHLPSGWRASFSWIPETTDLADKQRPAIENIAKALNLDAPDGVGWDMISAYAGEARAAADPQNNGLICSPVEASFDDVAADELGPVLN